MLRAWARPTSSLRAMGLPHTSSFPRLQEVGPGTLEGVCREAWAGGRQLLGREQKPFRSLVGPGVACAVAPALSQGRERPAQDGCVADSPPRLFSLEVASHCTKGIQPERGRLERRAESFLKGSAVVVLRCSLHICGWRFPEFSEVNAGSARCRQIRFTSDLSNRLRCPLAATAAASQCGLCGPALKLD